MLVVNQKRGSVACGRPHRSLLTCLVGTEPDVHDRILLGFWWAGISLLGLAFSDTFREDSDDTFLNVT